MKSVVMNWQFSSKVLDFSSGIRIMGILNVTPDSFYDRYSKTSAAIDRGLQMVDEGADVIDIGGESSRPPLYGSVLKIDTAEEVRRVKPVITALRRQTSVPLSIDTVKYEVAYEALDAGADIIMGHHSHVLQPFVRKEDNRIVYYGLGSLVFGDFIHDGELRALRLKTKKAVIPCIELNNMSVNYIHTKDTKGNEIKIIRGNYIAWSNRKLWLSRMANSNYIFRLIIKLKEAIFDRLIDILFGYYRTPLMVFKSMKKINILIKDLKK